MKLKEWCEQTGIKLTAPTTERGAVSFTMFIDRLDGTVRWFLYHLDDYKVSSVCGVVVWLVPVKPKGVTAIREAIDKELDSLDSLLWLTPYLGQLQAKLRDLKEFLETPRNLAPEKPIGHWLVDG